MPISDKLIDQLLEGNPSREEILGENGLLKELTKKVAERALEAEMESHLGYSRHSPSGNNSGNSRNGKSRKSVRSVHGAIDLDVPRDRNSSFEPKLVRKGEKQLHGFDERIISLYAKGMTTRDTCPTRVGQVEEKRGRGLADFCAVCIMEVSFGPNATIRLWMRQSG
jgi:putative transposase